MSTLLAIDTSSARAVVGLRSGGRVFGRESEAGQRASRGVLRMIDEVTAEAGAGLRELDAIAVVSGPGSFTGLRVGIGVAQGLALANGTPVLTCSSLALLAWTAMAQVPLRRWLVAVRARKGEIYLGAWRARRRSGLERVGRERVGAPEALDAPAGWRDAPCGATGDGWSAAVEEALGIRPRRRVEARPDARSLCGLAGRMLEDGAADREGPALPNYVKERLEYT